MLGVTWCNSWTSGLFCCALLPLVLPFPLPLLILSFIIICQVQLTSAVTSGDTIPEASCHSHLTGASTLEEMGKSPQKIVISPLMILPWQLRALPWTLPDLEMPIPAPKPQIISLFPAILLDKKISGQQFGGLQVAPLSCFPPLQTQVPLTKSAWLCFPD